MKQTTPKRDFHTPFTQQPKLALLGTVPFTTIVTNAGGGQTIADGAPVTRWRRDATLDDHGQWIYVQDVTTGRTWSAAYQPAGAHPDSYKVRFGDECVMFERRDGEIETRMEISVSSADRVEVRKLTIANTSSSGTKEIELTSYSDIVMNSAHMDRGHPAFSNLFVQTEWLAEHNAILAMRRPRSAAMKPVWGGHVLAVATRNRSGISCETDRSNFIGRGRSCRNAVAMDKSGPLSGRVGAVLDPVFSVRIHLVIPAGESVEAAFTTFVADERDNAIETAKRFSRLSEALKIGTRSRANESGTDASDSSLYQALAGHLLFPLSRDADSDGGGSSALFPLVVATVDDAAHIETVRALLKLHRYWQGKGIESDLLIVASDAVAQLDELASYMGDSKSSGADRVGEIVVRSLRQMGVDELKRTHAVARMHIDCDAHTLESFAMELESKESGDSQVHPPIEIATPTNSVDAVASEAIDANDLRFFNGIGGFNDSNEYEIRLANDVLPPAPWINVIANELAGFTVSETGAGCTWTASSNSFRLTPWHNDPVCDRPGECIYLRDDESGELWSPASQPIRQSTPYVVRHGAGYSMFDHSHDGISTSLRMGVPQVDTVKLQILDITNSSDRPRKLSVVSYAEWVLGTDREATRLSIDTSFDAASEVMLASNHANPEFAKIVAFHSISERAAGTITSREEFLGRNGALSAPRALAKGKLTSAGGKPIDPCSAIQVQIELDPGQTHSIAIALGATEGRDAAVAMARKYKNPVDANSAIDAAVSAWRRRLDTIVARTPEPSFDLMLNQWAYYQALSSRVWGRNALYQSSGAYGFRDQLQDVTAFVYSEPQLARAQILRAASRQFEEGDVQHWWHPHSGRGVRTLFSDDLIWLPFVTDHYLRVTHDDSVLDEGTRYLQMRQLEPGEDELYAVPDISDKSATVFEHCVHALKRACTIGDHGLPLMGSGDWNDGMNRVGIQGKGESVWLAWFLITTLRRFADHAASRNHADIATDLRRKADNYKEAIEASAWDGEWYRRAYYDDGAALGSHANEECKIDSIAQSWSVISGAGDAERSSIAMQSLNKHLVREDARLLMLLTPPFDRGTHDPGYIQGYLPGVRENGAQYTHAALWAVLATAIQGHGDRAMELYQMINPITHASTPDDVATYKVEPYVVAADVYIAEGHVGRGGWTWYTGSASWLYRVGLESILGFTKRGNELEIDPCIPHDWKGFSLQYKFGGSTYAIEVINPDGVQRGVASVEVDGAGSTRAIHLVDDGKHHAVTVTMGSDSV